MKYEQVRQSATERWSRVGRNVNALGALAFGAVALAIPGPNVLIAGYAGFNAAQAAGFELLRDRAKRKRVSARKKSA